MLVNARIKRFVSFRRYQDDTFSDLFREASITVEIKERPPATISYLD
jgi:dCMP deaminase